MMETESPERPVKFGEIGDENCSRETSELIEMIKAMPIEEQRELIASLKMRRRKTKRKNSRKSYFVSVQFSSSELAYGGYITNMSFTGAFIEAPKTDLKRLKDNKVVMLIFQHPETKENVKLKATIVRIDENGVGVKFMDPLNIKSDYWAG